MVMVVLALVLVRPSQAETKPELILYYGQGCPHCATVLEYFANHSIEDRFTVVKKEVYQHSDNAQELAALFDQFDLPAEKQGVPFMLLNGTYAVGDQPIIDSVSKNTLTTNVEATPLPAPTKVPTPVTWWAVTGAALVDAINPCAFAVLIILMATVLAGGQRRRAWLSGLAFIAAVYISYLAMGFGLYSAVAAVGVTWWIQKAAGSLAIGLGLFNLKDAFWYGRGGLMEVPLSWRPRMKALLQSVSSPVSAVLVGFAVSLFLLPCTSGPYIVIIGMLGQSATRVQAVWWLVYYNLLFILPMLAIILAVYFGLQPAAMEALRQRRLRWLHAVAGGLLLALGLWLVFSS